MTHFRRQHRNLPYRRKFYIYTEGKETERAYLKVAAKKLGLAALCELHYQGNDTNIQNLIDQALKDEKNSDFRPKLGDQIWILVDHDEQCHFEHHFQALYEWEQGAAHRHVALSTPRFEYWLLLHFMQDPTKKNALSDSFVEAKLPHFKNLPIGTPSITKATIELAVQRANARCIPTPANPNIVGSGMGKLTATFLDLTQA